MKTLKICVVFFFALGLFSCEKEELDFGKECGTQQFEKGQGCRKRGKGKKGKKPSCGIDKFDKLEQLDTCVDYSLFDLNNLPANIVAKIVKPLAFDSTGICPVAGFVKYIDTVQQETVALINYFPVTKTNGFAVKVTCIDGACKGPAAEKCLVELPCFSTTTVN